MASFLFECISVEMQTVYEMFFFIFRSWVFAAFFFFSRGIMFSCHASASASVIVRLAVFAPHLHFFLSFEAFDSEVFDFKRLCIIIFS